MGIRLDRSPFAPLLLLAALTVSPALRAATPACDAAPFRQFDFWLGAWDVYDVGSPELQARVTVTPVQGNCGLREQYQDTAGNSGESLSMYDPTTARWQQTWLSSRGQIIFLDGKLEGQPDTKPGAATMALKGTDHSANQQRQVRVTWKPEKDAVRETAERSSDNGKTWVPWFDLLFKHAAKS